jgi:hypothetical protein
MIPAGEVVSGAIISTLGASLKADNPDMCRLHNQKSGES